MKKLTLILILLVGLAGCDTRSAEPSSLPKGAVVKQDLGNGWIIFEHNNREFLYHKSDRIGGYSFECITELSNG